MVRADQSEAVRFGRERAAGHDGVRSDSQRGRDQRRPRQGLYPALREARPWRSLQTRSLFGVGETTIQRIFADRARVACRTDCECRRIRATVELRPVHRDQITGGVFTVYGAHVAVVKNHGPVTTYGVNDMVLDNWGVVDRWIAEEKITSHGPSGIGFVNFGTIHDLRVAAPIETFGQGARGFNVYTGTVGVADFDRVVTHADGAVGVQISQPIGRLVVRRGIETFGGTGQSLVKGVVMTLSAIGLSIKPGGSAREIEIAGGIKTNGAGVAPIENLGAMARHCHYARSSIECGRACALSPLMMRSHAARRTPRHPIDPSQAGRAAARS